MELAHFDLTALPSNCIRNFASFAQSSDTADFGKYVADRDLKTLSHFIIHVALDNERLYLTFNMELAHFDLTDLP